MAEIPPHLIPQNVRPCFVGLFLKGPRWTAHDGAGLHELEQSHLAFLRSITEQGFCTLAGSLVDGGRLQGLTVLVAATKEEAERVLGADPAVQAGHLACEVHPAVLPSLEGVVKYATTTSAVLQ